MQYFRFIIASFIALSIVASSPAMSMDLQDARIQQLVGEGPDGYVVAIGRDHDISELVASINEKRKQEYARIAEKEGQSVSVVAKLASKQIIKGLKPGMRYQDTSGNWHTR